MKLAAALMGAIFLSSSVMAAQNGLSVATIEALKGNVLVENVDGSRKVAKAKANLREGQTLIILEKAEVSLKYASSKCAVTHRGTALLNISEGAQCAASQKVGVGFAGGAGAATSFGAMGASTLVTAVGLVAVTAVVVAVVDDDDDLSSNN